MFNLNYVGNYSQFLIRLAWTVEIIAVLIGFTISIVVALSAGASYEAQGGLISRSASMLVAGLPFLLIAVVELCKIPLTFAFLAVKNPLWRSLFLFFVMFLCLITFETMFNGFERNFSLLNYAIDTRKNDIENIDSEIVLVERRIDRIQTFTPEELATEVETEQTEIDRVHLANVTAANRRAQQALASLDYSFRSEIQDEIEALMVRRDGYYDQWTAENQLIEDRFSALLLDNISDSRSEKERLLQERDELKQEMADKLSAATFFTRGAVDTKYRELIRRKDAEISQITTGYLGGDALVQQVQMEDQMKQQLAFAKEKYEGRIEDINQLIANKKREIAEQEAENQDIVDNAQARADKAKSRSFANKRKLEVTLEDYRAGRQDELDAISAEVFKMEEQIFRLLNDQRNIEAGINHLTNQNQIYRLAMYAYGVEHPADINRQMVAVVATIWFGSLALISSVTGVMLALAGFYMKRMIGSYDDNPDAHVTVGKAETT